MCGRCLVGGQHVWSWHWCTCANLHTGLWCFEHSRASFRPATSRELLEAWHSPAPLAGQQLHGQLDSACDPWCRPWYREGPGPDNLAPLASLIHVQGRHLPFHLQAKLWMLTITGLRKDSGSGLGTM